MWLGVRLGRDGVSPARGLVPYREPQKQGKGERLEAGRSQGWGLMVRGCAIRKVFGFPSGAKSQCLPFTEGMCWEAHESGSYHPLSLWCLEKEEKYPGTAALAALQCGLLLLLPHPSSLKNL